MVMTEASVLVPLHSFPVFVQSRKIVIPQQLSRLVPCERLLRARCFRPLSARPEAYSAVSGSDELQENVERGTQVESKDLHQVEDIYAGSSLSRTGSKKKVETHLLEESSSLNRQILLKFPSQQLEGKVVLVRCDFNLWFKGGEMVAEELLTSAIPTLAHLCNVGCKVVVATHWSSSGTPQNTMETSLVADALSRFLKREVLWVDAVVGEGVEARIMSLHNGNILLLGNLKLYKEEDANDTVFSKALTVKVDHLVNDAFRVSHRALASTVGAATSTCARIAGLQFAKELSFMRKIRESLIHPFVAIACPYTLVADIGGRKLSEKVEVLEQVLSTCDKLFVTGPMVFTMLKAAGVQVPLSTVEQDMLSRAKELMQSAREKKIELQLPKDFMLEQKDLSNQIMNSSVSCPVPEGWQLLDLGQDSYKYMLTSVEDSKMVLWLGSCAMGPHVASSNGMRLLAEAIGHKSLCGCVTIVGGKEVVECLTEAGVINVVSHVCHTGAAFWQLLKGHTLPGVAALDPASPSPPDWQTVFKDPSLPLTIDIGSGNGLFILRIAKSNQQRNFLGLEIFRKLVERCIESAVVEQLSNTHFMAVNATSSLQSIVASYPGKIALVTIQCPDPNFSRPSSRWRMVQRQLVEAVISTLCPAGKVFLQSDVKAVLEAMLQEFEIHARGKCVLSSEHSSPQNCDEYGWLNFNPLEASTDWEDHAVGRGCKMYRVLLHKL